MKVTLKFLVFIASGVAFVALACLAYFFSWSGGSTNAPANRDIFQAESGAEIADYLLHTARENEGVVQLSGYQSKICLEPPGGLARPAAERLHGMPVAFEESDASEGVWSLSLERAGTVYIYSIPLSRIDWKFSEDEDVFSELNICHPVIYIDFSTDVPSFSVKK